MSLIDWILNFAAVLLWMDWRTGRTGRIQSVLSIASAVRPADRKRGQGFGSLAILLSILLLRPLFYYSVGPSANWVPTLDLFAISIPWRSDLIGRMFIFSTVSFALALGYYYAWMLLLSAINRKEPETEVMQRFVRGQLGLLEKVPWWIKILLPSIAAALCWAAFSPLLIELDLVSENQKPNALWGQAGAFALAALLAWKWLLLLVFLLHLLNIYVYLGAHPAWAYISNTARRLLLPLSFLKFGKVDLAPAAGIGAALALAEFAIKPGVLELLRRSLP